MKFGDNIPEFFVGDLLKISPCDGEGVFCFFQPTGAGGHYRYFTVALAVVLDRMLKFIEPAEPGVCYLPVLLLGEGSNPVYVRLYDYQTARRRADVKVILSGKECL